MLKKESKFILINGNEYHDAFKLNKKQMKLIFDDQYESVKSFIKENEIDDKFVGDLRKLLIYLDSL